MTMQAETVEYIENKKNKYEKKYGIKILEWFVRKSSIRGLQRVASDLDVVFVFKKMTNQNRKIIFERSDRRCEFQCWDIEDVVDVLIKNKERIETEKEFKLYYKDNELKHYVLDYYNGFCCGIGNELKKTYYNYAEQCESLINQLYEPKVIAYMSLESCRGMLRQLECGYMVSLNRFINCIFDAMLGMHVLDGGEPGNVLIMKLADKYLDENEKQTLMKMVNVFKKAVQKQTNYSWFTEEKCILEKLTCELIQKIDSYNTRDICSQEIHNKIEQYLTQLN